MSRAVAIGARPLVAGYALAGVEVVEAHGPEAVRAAWQAIPDDVALLILTREASQVLTRELEQRPELPWTVLPA
jgi:vacuolar-type H+-ATPase subunit F/Vma7